ncbi:MAG: Rab family GTPase [Candidatus Freyarchaeum deiterrae]
MSLTTYIHKIIVCGDGAVGKTSIIKKYSENTFNENYLATVGCNFATKKIHINGLEITCQIWDMGGQPQFKVVRQNLYRGARGVVYVFDISRRETFENIQKWREEIGSVLTDPPCILIGNKVDLPRKVSEEEAKEYSLKNNTQYFEASVAENLNIQESMDRINQIILEKQENERKTISPIKISAHYQDLIKPSIQSPATIPERPLNQTKFPLTI